MRQQSLCKAIQERKLIKFCYRQELNERTFAPYIVFRTDKGHVQVFGYQEHNPAKPSERHEGRNFEVSEIGTLTITTESFVPRPDFDPFNKRYAAGIICHVKQHF